MFYGTIYMVKVLAKYHPDIYADPHVPRGIRFKYFETYNQHVGMFSKNFDSFNIHISSRVIYVPSFDNILIIDPEMGKMLNDNE